MLGVQSVRMSHIKEPRCLLLPSASREKSMKLRIFFVALVSVTAHSQETGCIGISRALFPSERRGAPVS